MEEMKKHVESLISRAATACNSQEALEYSQAASNAAAAFEVIYGRSLGGC